MTILLARPAAGPAARTESLSAPSPEPVWRLARPVAVVWRPGPVLQVGLDDDPCVLLPEAPPRADLLVRALRRDRTARELTRLLPEIDEGWLSGALARLDAGGVLRRGPRPDRPTVALHGAGPLAEAVAALLAGEGVDLLVVDPGQPSAPDAVRARSERWRTVARRHRRGALADLVEPWQADAPGPAVAIVCPPTIEPDRGLTDALTRAGRPHLVVRCEPGRAVVGPFVVPGRTSCVRCSDRERVRRDPQWPYVLAQLCLAPAAAPGLIRQWAAVTGAAQTLAFLRGALPETLGATLELPAEGLDLQVRTWAPDPACGCASPGAGAGPQPRWEASTSSTPGP